MSGENQKIDRTGKKKKGIKEEKKAKKQNIGEGYTDILRVHIRITNRGWKVS